MAKTDKTGSSNKEASLKDGNSTVKKSGLFRFFAFVAALLILLIAAGLIGYPLVPAPKVEGYSLKDNARKISYNAPIKIVFTQPMDKGSVEGSFHIEPVVKGKFEWNNNTLSFVPESKLEVGKSFTVTVEKKAKSFLQKSLPSDYEEVFKVIEAPKVILINPAPDSSEVGTDAKITVLFDRPMTALTGLDKGLEATPTIQITPAVKGKYKWLGTSSISFIPERLKYATKYSVTVPKGTVSADGGESESDFVYSFTTLKPALVNTFPEDMSPYNGPKTKIKLAFNQMMDLPAAVNGSINLYVADPAKSGVKMADNNGQKLLEKFDSSKWIAVSFDAAYYSEKDYNADLKANTPDIGAVPYYGETTIPSAEELKKSLVLTPKTDLPYGSLVLVKIGKGYKGTEGDFALEKDEGFAFSIVNKLKVLSTSPVNNVSNASYNEAASITFSQPIDISTFQDKVAIVPANVDKDTKLEQKPNVNLDGDGTGLWIYYDFKPSISYTVTVKAGGNDKFGQTLEQDYVLNFKTMAAVPDFELMSRSDISVLDANKASVYYLKSTNVDDIRFNFKKLNEEEFNKIYSFGYVNSDAIGAVSGPFTTFSKKVANKFNSQIVTKLDLAKESGLTLDPGLYYLDASSDQVVDDYTKKPRIYRQVIVLTRTGLAVKKSKNSLAVWATSLKDGSPVANLALTIKSQKGAADIKTKTNNEGWAEVKLPTLKNEDDYYSNEFTIISSQGPDFALTHSTWGDGVSPWNFSLSYDANPGQYFSYIYTDRPIYRPGHDVFFKGLLRKDLDAKFLIPDLKKVHVLVNDSNGEKVLEKDLALNANGTFNDQLKIGDKAKTGYYSIVVTLPDAGPSYQNSFYASFMVAEYRKPDYEINLTPDKENYVSGDKAKINVKAAYFFGAPMPNAEIDYSVRSQDYYFFINSDSQSPYASKWYSFSDQGYSCWFGCDGQNAVVATGKAKLNSMGEYSIELPLDIKEKKVSQLYTVEATAYDLNNQSVSNRVTLPVHQGEYYVGILNEDYLVKRGDPIKFEVITVDNKGASVAGKQVEVTFYKREWNTIKKKNVGGGFYYENGYEDTKVTSQTVTTDDKGHTVATFTSKDGGVFKAQAVSKDSRGNSISASADVYVSSDTFINWGRENNDKIELVPDKLEYKPGDTAHILVKSPYTNVWALVTEERQNILSKKIIQLKTNSDTIDIPITDKSIPNLFVSVLIVKGSGAGAGLAEPAAGASDERDVAAFKMGYATLQVNTASKKLNIEVTSDKKTYHPGDEVTLNVKTTDNDGKVLPAEVSLSVVDKSVLSLTENVTADLLNAFYRKRMLGVSTSDTLTKALSRVNVQVEAGLKGGGGGDMAKRGTFKDTAFWKATVETNPNGEAQVKFKLPDNLTTWQTMAIGITKDTLVGSQKSEFIVTKDVLIRSVLPRFLIQKDTLKVGAIVHNYLDKTVTVDVSADVTGLKLTSAAKQTITLNSKEEKKVEWNAEVSDGKEAVFNFKAVTTDNANVGDVLEQKLPIEPYSFPEVVATSAVITDNDKLVEIIWLPSDIDLNFGELTIGAASTLAGSITTGLEYLMSYPYGCVEQTTSALLPNVVVKQVLNLPGLKNSLVDEKQLQKNVEASLQALYKYQQASGGWGIWENSQTSPYLSSYVLFTLNETKKAGYTVDQTVIDRGVKFVKGYISGKPINKKSKYAEINYEANVRAYTLYVLAEMGKGDLGLSNNLYDYKADLSIFGKAYLVMNYNLLKKSNEAAKPDLDTKIGQLKNEILNLAKESPRGIHFEEKETNYRLFDTNSRTTALVLQMLSGIDPEHPYVQKILRNLLMEKKDGRYATTHETAIILIAMVDYLKSSKELEPSFNGIITVNGASKLNKSYTQKNLTEKDRITIALKDLIPDNADNEIEVTRAGTGKYYFDMNLKYYLPTERILQRDEGMVVNQEYFADTDTKMENPVDTVKVGQNLKARITVIAPEDRYYVMVEDYLPAGLEGIDFSLKTSKQDLQNQMYRSGGEGANADAQTSYYGGYNSNIWAFNYSEVRDDRMMYFADFLPKGVYEIEYFVRATTPGVYHDLPVLAQELYFPEVFGRSAGRILTVNE